MNKKNKIEVVIKRGDYLAAVVWAWHQFGPAPDKWNWTILELNKIAKFDFDNEEDAVRFKLTWG